ncbi:MAG: hypothetical protein HWD59_07990 [Coxiellaceae bacterium]|nr:MAG: hypothetical protein HWD59_07990 [Coxiellaceae bacterium]
MSDTEATAFGVTQYAYIVILTFITAFPLGKAIVEIALDIVTGQYQWPAKLQLLANMLLGLCTLAICVLGGLPNVWQANYENKDPWLAEFASAVTELVGTYILLGIITTQMALLMGALIRCCLAEPPNNQYEKEILVNDDELNNKFPEQRATWNKAHSTPSSRNRWYFFCCGKPRVEGYKKMADQSDDLEGPEDHGFS